MADALSGGNDCHLQDAAKLEQGLWKMVDRPDFLLRLSWMEEAEL
jgi:hypothetical protein